MTTTTHGACGKTWDQRGNKSGHCSGCHDTYYGITAFDAHQRLENDRIICSRPDTTSKGRPIPWWQDNDGQWHMGERMTDEQKRERGWIA